MAKIMRGIKEIKAEKSRVLAEFHAKNASLDAEIEAVRTARGTKLKVVPMESWYEEGRDRDPNCHR